MSEGWVLTSQFLQQRPQPAASDRVTCSLWKLLALKTWDTSGSCRTSLLAHSRSLVEWVARGRIVRSLPGPTALCTEGPPAPALGHSCSVWPLASRDEGGTGHWLPALGSQKQDPAAKWTPQQPPPSTLSVSGRVSSRHLSPPCMPPSAGVPRAGQGMNREGAPGKSPEDVYVQQKVRVLLMLRKMGSNVSAVRWVMRLSPRGAPAAGGAKAVAAAVGEGAC